MGRVVAKVIGMILVLLQLIVSVVFMGFLFLSKYLTTDWMLIVALVLLILVFLNLILQRWLISGIFGKLLAIFLCVALGYGCYMLFNTNMAINKITADANGYKEIDQMNIYVLKDDVAQSVNDASAYTFGILGAMDRENTDYTIQEIESNLGSSLTLKEYDEMTSLADGLYNSEVGAIIINEAYAAVLSDTEGYEDFDSKVRTLTSVSHESETVQALSAIPANEITEKPFVLYLSGCDQSGDISTRGRSDVNILAIVNPNTKQILLLSTPRDYYVELASHPGEMKDKLAHAGIWGIEESMNTLGNLYGLDIDMYFKVNFTGFKDVINALGGIEVDSDVAFEAGTKASSQSEEETYTFTEGINQLDGDAALAFARERHAFASGDNQRGKNQMKVIAGVVKKMQSSTLLTNYAEIMNSVSESFETNMTTEQIQALVKMQLTDMASWSITTHAVVGSDDSQKTYSSPRLNHYVMIPNEESVDQAKALIEKVENGESITEEDLGKDANSSDESGDDADTTSTDGTDAADTEDTATE